MTPTMEKAARAAKKEVARLRRTRVPEYPGSWKTHEGLGWQNLDEVSEAVTRAVLLAIREPDEGMVEAADSLPDHLCGSCHIETATTFGESHSFVKSATIFTAMIDAIIGEETA